MKQIIVLFIVISLGLAGCAPDMAELPTAIHTLTLMPTPTLTEIVQPTETLKSTVTPEPPATPTPEPIFEQKMVELKLNRKDPQSTETLSVLGFMPNIPEGADQETIDSINKQTVQEVIDYIINDNVDWGNKGNEFISETPKEEMDFRLKLAKIEGINGGGAFSVPYKLGINPSDQFMFEITSFTYNGNDISLVIYLVKDETIPKSIIIGVDEQTVTTLIQQNVIEISHNIPQETPTP